VSILTIAVRTVPGGWVDIEATASGHQATISIQSRGSHLLSSPLAHGELEGLSMARRLVEISGGTLEVIDGEAGESPLSVKMVLPTGRRTVLVVDDNADTLRLYQHYLADTDYSFVGASDAERAIELATIAVPHLVVLDVMLPGMDGWQLLARLREHPATRDVPIVVCSILPEEYLAMALGAAAFLRKPVSREALLSVLDRQLDWQIDLEPQEGR
jgi:CheY-like chemotaxis protein